MNSYSVVDFRNFAQQLWTKFAVVVVTPRSSLPAHQLRGRLGQVPNSETLFLLQQSLAFVVVPCSYPISTNTLKYTGGGCSNNENAKEIHEGVAKDWAACTREKVCLP